LKEACGPFLRCTELTRLLRYFKFKRSKHSFTQTQTLVVVMEREGLNHSLPEPNVTSYAWGVFLIYNHKFGVRSVVAVKTNVPTYFLFLHTPYPQNSFAKSRSSTPKKQITPSKEDGKSKTSNPHALPPLSLTPSHQSSSPTPPSAPSSPLPHSSPPQSS
jgi:hypothetical protein